MSPDEGMNRHSPHMTSYDQLGEQVEEEYEVYIDVGQLGNLFSHEGSSFYLRMGTLSRWHFR